MRTIRAQLLGREPVRVVAEHRALKKRGTSEKNFEYLSSIWSELEFADLCERCGVAVNDLTAVQTTVGFEKVPSATDYQKDLDSEVQLKLVKIMDEGNLKDLISFDDSIIKVLSAYEHETIRLYGIVDIEARDRLRREIGKLVQNRRNSGQNSI